RLEVEPQLGRIEADERKVKQVVFNLLSNAVKFTPPGGQVHVRAWREGKSVWGAGRDTGVGIAPEGQARVFEGFQQAQGKAPGWGWRWRSCSSRCTAGRSRWRARSARAARSRSSCRWRRGGRRADPGSRRHAAERPAARGGAAAARLPGGRGELGHGGARE